MYNWFGSIISTQIDSTFLNILILLLPLFYKEKHNIRIRFDNAFDSMPQPLQIFKNKNHWFIYKFFLIDLINSILFSKLVGSGGDRRPSEAEVRAAIWEACGDSGAFQLLGDLLNNKCADYIHDYVIIISLLPCFVEFCLPDCLILSIYDAINSTFVM